MVEEVSGAVEVVVSLEVLEARVRIVKAKREKIMESFILMVLMLS